MMKKNKSQNRPISGRFQKGQSGNPGGRPKTPEWFKEHTNEALEKILQLMNSSDEKISLQASTLVLAYSFGKPTEHIEVTDVTDYSKILKERRAKIKRAA